MIRRPPRSTLDRSSAASDVYKRQLQFDVLEDEGAAELEGEVDVAHAHPEEATDEDVVEEGVDSATAAFTGAVMPVSTDTVSYTHLTLPTSDLV